MFQWTRMFSTDGVKGQPGYLRTQRMYEILRTVIYFGISMAIFVMGILSTGSKMNLLTVVAVLGCLPACKSLVSVIMFLRFPGTDPLKAEKYNQSAGTLYQLHDMIFTAYQTTFCIDHMVIDEKQICAYSGQPKFDESAFEKHLKQYLGAEGIKEFSVKVFTDEQKYIDRIMELSKREHETGRIEEKMGEVLKSIVL